MQPAGRDLLAALAAVLNRWGRWYLFGAQAVVAHGVPRLGADADLVIAKILAGRPKDLEGVRSLWRLHGTAVDHRRIRRLLRSLEAALDRSDLVSGFEAMRRAVQPR